MKANEFDLKERDFNDQADKLKQLDAQILGAEQTIKERRDGLEAVLEDGPKLEKALGDINTLAQKLSGLKMTREAMANKVAQLRAEIGDVRKNQAITRIDELLQDYEAQLLQVIEGLRLLVVAGTVLAGIHAEAENLGRRYDIPHEIKLGGLAIGDASLAWAAHNALQVIESKSPALFKQSKCPGFAARHKLFQTQRVR